MAQEAVLQYLLDTNRPYSCTDVTANLRGAHAKAAVQRALDALAESGRLRCKVYGKQKVYVAPQQPDPEAADATDDVDDLEKLSQALTVQLSGQTSALKSAEAAVKSLTSAPTDSRASEELAESRARVEGLKRKLNELRTSTNVVSVEDRKRILDEHTMYLKAYKKRKSICTQMMDAILEGYPKSKKCLIEELCMETDEMVQFAPTAR